MTHFTRKLYADILSYIRSLSSSIKNEYFIVDDCYDKFLFRGNIYSAILAIEEYQTYINQINLLSESFEYMMQEIVDNNAETDITTFINTNKIDNLLFNCLYNFHDLKTYFKCIKSAINEQRTTAEFKDYVSKLYNAIKNIHNAILNDESFYKLDETEKLKCQITSAEEMLINWIDNELSSDLLLNIKTKLLYIKFHIRTMRSKWMNNTLEYLSHILIIHAYTDEPCISYANKREVISYTDSKPLFTSIIQEIPYLNST